jgi:hypothetical protein
VFKWTGDGSVGPSIVDPTPAPTWTPPHQPLIAAMAGFGAGAVATVAAASPPRLAYAALARPA